MRASSAVLWGRSTARLLEAAQAQHPGYARRRQGQPALGLGTWHASVGHSVSQPTVKQGTIAVPVYTIMRIK